MMSTIILDNNFFKILYILINNYSCRIFETFGLYDYTVSCYRVKLEFRGAFHDNLELHWTDKEDSGLYEYCCLK